MGGFGVVPNPYPDQLLDVLWPAVNTGAADGAVFDTNGNPRYGIGTTYAVWGANYGAGTNNMGRPLGVYGGQFTSNGAGVVSGRGAYGYSAQPIFLPPVGATSALIMPEQCRVFGWTFLMDAVVLVNYTDLSGCTLQVAAGAVPGWIQGGNAGMGIVGDGAGGWKYVAKKSAGVGTYDEAVALTWPGAVNVWTRVDFVIKGATATGPAVFELWLNNVLQLSRTWAAGTFLPDYTAAAAPPNAARIIPLFQCGEAVLAGQLNIGAFRFQVGRFHPVTGLQVAS